ncbi:MAG: phosphatase PAP2 family protein [Planctomycetota bacterium]
MTLLPSVEVLGRAAKDAALDPWTWIPLAGVGVLLIDDWDEGVSDWAREETPVFGSQDRASDASDTLRDALFFSMIATSLATDSGEDPGTWAWSKTKGVGVSLLATSASEAFTVRAKDIVDRERPSGANRRSFPSKHATNAFSYARWMSDSLESVSMPAGLRTTLRVGANTTAAGVAWARVEAGHHYPADVLAGAAVGNFLTSFLHDAFMGLPHTVDLHVDPAPEGDGFMIGMTWRP